MINKMRLLTHLEVKGSHVIKGIRMEGLRKVGVPEKMSVKYFNDGIDEIVFTDIVASLYGRHQLTDLIKIVAEKIFVPLAVGGGVRSIDDFHKLLRAGADKIHLNTEAVKNPDLIIKAANTFGSQCVVVQIQAKKRKEGYWEAYTENGRERTLMDAVEWAQKVEQLGAGEIFLSSVDRDGTKLGIDHDFLKSVTDKVSIPVIASGGTKSAKDVSKAVIEGNANAVAVANLFHFNTLTIQQMKSELLKNGVRTRGC